MSRPFKQDSKKALENLEKAFWELLDEMSYKKITIKSLTDRAKVNHNTFYYHFRNMDEMAERFFYNQFSENLIPGVDLDLTQIIRILEENEPEVMDRWNKVSLFTCRDSDVLVSIFRKAMTDNWYNNNPQIKFDKLNDAQKSMLQFLESGVINVIAYARSKNDTGVLISFMKSPITAAIKETVTSWSDNA